MAVAEDALTMLVGMAPVAGPIVALLADRGWAPAALLAVLARTYKVLAATVKVAVI